MQAHGGQLERAILFVHSEVIIIDDEAEEVIIMDDEVCLGTHGRG